MSILLWFDPCAIEGISAAAFLRTEHSSTRAPRQDLLHRFASTKRVETTPRRPLPRTAPFSTPTGRVRGTPRRLPASDSLHGPRPRSSDSMESQVDCDLPRLRFPCDRQPRRLPSHGCRVYCCIGPMRPSMGLGRPLEVSNILIPVGGR